MVIKKCWWFVFLLLLVGCGDIEWFPDDTANTNVEIITTVQSSATTAKCCDGSFSESKNCQGTCSKHGGVLEWVNLSMSCDPPTACGSK